MLEYNDKMHEQNKTGIHGKAVAEYDESQAREFAAEFMQNHPTTFEELS
jgi:hypothetical protein